MTTEQCRTYAVTLQSATRPFTNAAATSAFEWPTSAILNEKENRMDESKENEPEQELPVEVRDVDLVHVDHVHVPKAGKRQSLEDLAAEAARSEHEDGRRLDELEVLKGVALI